MLVMLSMSAAVAEEDFSATEASILPLLSSVLRISIPLLYMTKYRDVAPSFSEEYADR